SRPELSFIRPLAYFVLRISCSVLHAARNTKYAIRKRPLDPGIIARFYRSGTMSYFTLTDEQAARFQEDGYLFVENLLDAEEVDLLLKIARADHRLAQESRAVGDKQGGQSRISLRNDLHDDIYSAIVRSRRMADTMERLLGGEVYHYHHKMTMKEPFTGGAWE